MYYFFLKIVPQKEFTLINKFLTVRFLTLVKLLFLITKEKAFAEQGKRFYHFTNGLK